MNARTVSCAALVACSLAGAARAQVLDTVRLSSGFNQPLYATAPPGDERIFVVEQTSADIRILVDGAILPTPFADLTPWVTQPGGERGLLGLAFHPDYCANGYFYVGYTTGASPGRSVVARIRVTADPNVADVSLAKPPTEILTLTQPFSNHNGGCLQFGPDGYLYIGFGDGGSGGDPSCFAQKGNTWLGKMLRIDVDGAFPYAVPPTNPFTSPTDGILDEIWFFGLRNPWRYSFDRLTGDLYLGDVGQNAIEEIDVAPAGASGLNFGWKIMEGLNCFGSSACPVGTPACMSPAFTNPIQTYTHAQGCSVTAGYVYRGCAIPDLQGTFFYADYCSATIWSLRYDVPSGTVSAFTNQTAALAPGGGLSIGSITSFGEDGFGELLIVDQGTTATNGEVYKIVGSPAPLADCDGNGYEDACEVAQHPAADLDFDGTPDACQTLHGDVDCVSVAFGGAQQLALHAGAAHAGEIYLLLGTTSGTSPGTPVDLVTLPLNVDAYTLFSLTSPRTPPLTGNLGVLDVAGQGQCQFSVPAGTDPSLAGTLVDHAYVVLQPVTHAAHVASNPVRVRLE